MKLIVRTLRFYQNNKQDIGIYTLAFTVRFILFFIIVVLIGEKGLKLGDSVQYIGLARSLLNGQGFVLDGMPFFFRTIGYPFFLAGGLIIFRGIVGFVFFQIILSSFLPLIIKRLAKQLGMSEKIAFMSACVVACEPHLVFYSVTVMTESIYTLILFAGCLYIFRAMEYKKYVYSVYAGILFGIGMLVKPLLQLFPPIFFICILPWRKKISLVGALKHVAIILGICFVVSFSWMYRNYSIFHSFALSNQGSGALLGYLGTSIVSVRDKITYQDAEKKVLAEFTDRNGAYISEANRGRLYNTQAFEYIKMYPNIFGTLLIINTITFWTSSNYNSFLNYYHLVPAIDHSVLPPTHYLAQGRMREFFFSFWKIFSQPFYFIGVIGRIIWTTVLFLFLFGVLKAYASYPTNRYPLIFLMSLCVYLTMMVWVDGLGIEARLRYPLIPIEILYAVYGYTILQKKYGHEPT